MNKVRCMLYVMDVEKVAQFWQDHLDARMVAVRTMPDGSSNIILSVLPEFELALFSKAFIAEYSPEVAANRPSLMFFSNRFNELHQQIPNAGPIVDNQGQLTFNFADPEDHYFVVAKA